MNPKVEEDSLQRRKILNEENHNNLFYPLETVASNEANLNQTMRNGSSMLYRLLHHLV